VTESRGWGHPLAIGLVGALTMFGIGFRHAHARAPARTGAFVGPEGRAARPVSEARALWDDANLYLSLYAADEDIRAAKVAPDGPVWAGDSFTVEIGPAAGATRSITVGPSGTITDVALPPGKPADPRWQSGAKAAIDLDDPRDRDEEWVVELAIPFHSLAVAPGAEVKLAITLRRCDVHEGGRRCGTWAGLLRLAR